MAENQETPEQAIEEIYDSNMDSPYAGLIRSISQADMEYNSAIQRMAAGQAQAETDRFQQERDAPTGFGRDPKSYLAPTFAPQDAFTVAGGALGSTFGPTGLAFGTGLGSAIAELTGSESKFQRSIKAGTGQLIQGTGDTYEFLKAVVTPWDEDVDQETTIGNFFQRQGAQLSAANNVYIPESMKSVGWSQLANPDFWATDVARLVPYSMSFFLPAGVVAKGTRILLNSNRVYQSARAVGLGEKLYKPTLAVASKREARRRGLQAGEKFLRPQLRKGVSITASSIGGGVGGNYAEGAFVAGETFRQAIADGLTPQEAQAAAAQVWSDNTNWVLADIAQFGLTFGGLGRLAAGFRSLGKTKPFAQKITPFIQAGATGAVEGIAEQYQEVYQEWIKERNIAEKGGADSLTFTQFVKAVSDPNSEYRQFFASPEMLDVRVSAFALGATMGARGGYVDAIAERDYQLQEGRRRLGDLKDDYEFNQAQNMRKEIIAYTVIDGNGSAELAIQRTRRMVSENQMKPEVGAEIIEALEQAEDIYESSHRDNTLTQAGKRQIFIKRLGIAEINSAIERSNEERQAALDQAKEDNIDPTLLKQKEDKINSDYDTLIEGFNQDKLQLQEDIQNLSSVKLGKLLKDGSRVKKSSIGLTPKDFGEFTTEGRKQAQAQEDSRGFIKRATEAVTKGAKAVVEGVGKAVQTVAEKGVTQTAKDVVKSEPAKKLQTFLQDRFDKGTNYARKFLKQNAPKTSAALEREINAAREEFGDRVPTSEEIKSKAKEIIQKVKKTDFKGATGDVLDQFTGFVESKLKDKTVVETVADIIGGVVDKTKQAGKDIVDAVKGKAKPEPEPTITVDSVAEKMYESTRGGEQLTQEEVQFVQDNAEEVLKKVDEIGKQPGTKQQTEKKQRFTDSQVPVKREYFTVTNSDGAVQKFRVTTRLDGSRNWEILSGDRYVPFNNGKIADKSVIERDNLSTRQELDVFEQAGGVVTTDQTEGSDAVMNPKMKADLSEDQKRRVEENQPGKKAKKKSKKTVKQQAQKQIPDKSSDSEINKDFQKFIDQANDENINYKKSDKPGQVRQFSIAEDESNFFIRNYLRDTLSKKFPTINVEFTNRQLIEGFGAPASAIFLGSTALVNPRKAMQTDLIHELSHPYYQSLAGTPLQKRLNTLLIKRRVLSANGTLVGLLDNIQYSYPELTRYNQNGKIRTGGDILKEYVNNRNYEQDSPINSLLDTIVQSSADGNTTQYKNSVQEFFTNLVSQGAIKRLKDESQYGLLEEAFAYSNEDFNRKGGIANVIENKKEADKYESILKRMYKRIAGLATKEESVSAITEVVPETKNMTYEQVMTYVQNNFSILNEDNRLKQNSYSKDTMLKKSKFQVVSTVGLFNIIEQKVKSAGKKGEDVVQEIAKEIYKQNGKVYNTDKQKAPFEVSAIEHDYLLRKIRSQVDRATFKEYQRIIDGLIENVDKRLNQGERSDDSLEFSFNQEAEIVAEENDKGNIFDQEEPLFGETTSKLIQAYSIEESKKNDKNPVNVKELLSELYNIGQKTKKGNTFTFVIDITESDNSSVIRFRNYLLSKFKKQSLVDALLLEMSIDFANKQIETMKEVGFRRGDNGVTTWVPGVSFSTDEVRWQSSMTTEANNRWFDPRTLSEQDKESFEKIQNNLNKTENIADVLNAIYGDSGYWQFVDKRKLTETGNVYTYKGKRYRSLNVLVLQNKSDFIRNGRLRIKDGFDNLLADLIVQSRAKNYITQVNDVAENPTLIINKENSIHSKNENYATLAQENLGAFIDLMTSKGMEFASYKDGFLNTYTKIHSTGKELQVSMLSGVYSIAKYNKTDKRRNRKYTKMDSQELLLTDFNDFLYSLSRYKQGEISFYDQPIAVFGAAKRRYYVKTPIANTFQQRQELLKMAYNAGYNKAKYAKGSRVNPFRITLKNGEYSLIGMEKELPKFIEQIQKDKNQTKQNDLIKNLKRQDVKNYLLNYSINKFFAQEYLIGKHNQFDNEIDYIKRAEGAIKRHTPHARNTPIEFVAFKDITDFDGFIATDAQAYVLPGDGEIIRNKFGNMRKVGNQFKFVYDYVETNNKNENVFGKRTFAKFKIDEITPEMEKNSPYRKKIANILRARKDAIAQKRFAAGVEETGKLHDFIPIATFDSALKVYAPGNKYLYDLENTTEEVIVNTQDEVYDYNTWNGLSGEGFGVQLELDKERHSFHMPSQLFGHHHTNLEAGEQEMVNRMHQLAAEAMVGFEQERSRSVHYLETSTAEQRQADINFLTKLIGEEFFGNLNTSLSKEAPGLHPQLHDLIQQLAASRLTKFGTKAMFGGTIAYQTSPIGRDLKSYVKVSSLVDQVSGEQYKAALNKLIEDGKDYVVSEAIIPASAKKDGIKVGDLVLGTRIPAHGKQSSVVFVVRDFASEGENGARSTIEIPSRVSNVMGADLDGDAIFLNYSHVGNVPGTTKISPLGQEARIQTNLLKDYQISANELLDLNLKLLGDIDIDGRRYKEITTPIDIKEVAETAIKKVESFYGKKLVMENQLLPIGDAQYFNDNVPAQNMIGTIASLQRVLNVMAGHKVGFTFGINIKGYEEIDSLVDRFNENKPEGNAFTVAQLLNIVLDNAKYQYANKLGLTPNTVNIFTFLARNGISISDTATIMNHPIVKLYDKYRGDQSIMTTSNPNQALVNAYKDHFKVTIKEAKKKVQSFARSGDVNLDINKLKGKNANTENNLFDLLYKTEKLTDEIFSIGKALSVHKSIPVHGHDAQRLINTITQDRKGSFINPNTIGNFRSDPLVLHSLNLLEKQVNRQKSTTFMYTPEARQVIEYIESTRNIKLDFSRYEHKALINDYYLMKVSEAIPVLNMNGKTISEVYKILEDYSKGPGNNFVKEYLLFSNIDDSPYYRNSITINPNQINKFSVEETIQQGRNMFTELPTEIKDALLQYDFLKNGLGFKGKTLTSLFSKDYIRNKFELLDNLLEKEINNNVSVDDPSVVNKANELIITHNNLFKDEINTKISVEEKQRLQGKVDFEPGGTAKLKLNKREFYQDHLSELNKTLTYPEYLRFLGYDPSAVDNAEIKIKTYFQDRYKKYQDSVAKLQSKENRLGDLDKLSIEKLYDEARKIQDFEDELASPRLLHKIHLAIGNKVMLKQAQKIANATGEKFTTEQKDISTIRKWFGSNNMTSDRPEVQEMINEIEREYRKYIRAVKPIIEEINVVDKALRRSKRNTLKGIFSPRERQLQVYGKLFKQTEDGIALVTTSELNASNPTQEELNFYNKYKEITDRFRTQLGKQGRGEYYIPHVQMGNLEALSARGLLGLYANSLGSTADINNVKVYGTSPQGKRALQSFGYWKDLYLSEGGELTMPSLRKINELKKLKAKAEKQLEIGKHEDGDAIVATDLEMDTLMEGGLFSRFNASRTVRAKELTSFDIAENLRQYARSVVFVNGFGDFRGMNDVSTLVDAVIAVNNQMGNKNTAEYVTKVWRQNFLRGEKQTSVFGKNFDKVTQFMVRWTALIHLGFSAAVGVGNILAGKYQEVRNRGGKQFVLGEKRFWTSFTDKDWKGKRILKKFRIVEMSFADVVGQRDEFSKIESLAFLPMELSEFWIQGSAFLGELTEEEFNSEEVSEERVMEINAKIATLHGEGYTKLDQRLLGMYSLGVAAQQFKRWFITLTYNRLKQEDINRFGQKEIGSYRAAYDFVNEMFTGDAPLSEFQQRFNELPEFRQKAIISFMRGVGLTALLLLIGGISDDDEVYSKSIQKLSNDALIFTDTKRFVNYTIPPASISTGRNALQFGKELVTFERYQRDGRFGSKKQLKARSTATKILPFKAVTEKLLEQ